MGALGEYLGSLRRSRTLSIRQLASSARLSPSTLSRWESGRTRPSAYELDALLDAVKATPSERRQAWELLDASRAVRRLREGAACALAVQTVPSMPLAGDLLKSLRLRTGWTLQQTATQLQIHPATLSRWERTESWPTDEQLHRLCFHLHARAEEAIALSMGRLTLCYDQKPFPSGLPALTELVRDLEQAVILVEPALEDLYYLALEMHLWRLLQCNTPVLKLLISVYVRHARALVNNARLIEAQTPAYRALHLMSRAEPLDYRWLGAAHVVAKGAAESGSRPRPLQGVEVLRDWLPVAARLSRPYEAWFRRDLAEYLSQTRSHTQALETSQYAMQIGQGIGEDRHVLLSHALVLLNVGRPSEALELLESSSLTWDDNRGPMQTVHESIIWARALHRAGLNSEAFCWVERARRTVEAQNLWQVRSRVETLSRDVET
ncbi:MAG: helix-turn-helix domain-containing protein [Fimbriimonadales bacterium]|nr:helix-turn-helix domain-containing protein [Fimbriimonadales bacterium]